MAKTYSDLIAEAKESVKIVQLPEVNRRLEQKEPMVLVDVREKNEWDQGHIDGAVFLPLSAIQDGLSKEELARLPKDKILYVHCVVGKRALTGGNAIEKQGFTVRPIKQGYKELVAAGLPKAKD